MLHEGKWPENKVIVLSQPRLGLVKPIHSTKNHKAGSEMSLLLFISS